MKVSVQLTYSHGYWETPAYVIANVMLPHSMHSNITIQSYTCCLSLSFIRDIKSSMKWKAIKLIRATSISETSGNFLTATSPSFSPQTCISKQFENGGCKKIATSLRCRLTANFLQPPSIQLIIPRNSTSTWGAQDPLQSAALNDFANSKSKFLHLLRFFQELFQFLSLFRIKVFNSFHELVHLRKSNWLQPLEHIIVKQLLLQQQNNNNNQERPVGDIIILWFLLCLYIYFLVSM